MQQLLQYMYRGEISISQDDLGPLIETAKCLQIKGLAMAQPNVGTMSSPSPTNSKKRTLSQLSPTLETSPSSSSTPMFTAQMNKSKKTKTKHRPPSPNSLEEPVISSQEYCNETTRGEIPDEKPDIGEMKEYIPDVPMPDSIFKPGNQVSPTVTLPVLPKPLSILKTAETRTYLSKLIWLGNGGRRPQYGNPETKPSWWPQHILPWEEMKKMGGRKSVELSHINYTEILKQCLAAGYEYFGYDPSTYYNIDQEQDPALQQECSYVIDDGHHAAAGEDDPGASITDRSEQPLEIDLDHVGPPDNPEKTSACKTVRRSSDQKQILCK